MVKDPHSGAYFSLELFVFFFFFFYFFFFYPYGLYFEHSISFSYLPFLSRLETTYTQSAFVDYLAVSCGKNGVFAIISPNFGYILNWAKENNMYVILSLFFSFFSPFFLLFSSFFFSYFSLLENKMRNNC